LASPVKDEDIDKTCFVTRKGILGSKSFLLASATPRQHRLVDVALAGLTWEVCLAYLDDLIIFASSFGQHLERLQLALDTLVVEADLKLKRSKCALFQ